MITCHYCGKQLAPNSTAVWEHVKIHYEENGIFSQKHEISPKMRTSRARDLRYTWPIIPKMWEKNPWNQRD